MSVAEQGINWSSSSNSNNINNAWYVNPANGNTNNNNNKYASSVRFGLRPRRVSGF
jgi:hypothetical protein